MHEHFCRDFNLPPMYTRYRVGTWLDWDFNAGGRMQVRKEYASTSSSQRDVGAAAGYPFKEGIATMCQQIDIAKLKMATTIEEHKSLDQAFGTAMHNIQQDIDN